jgi:biopolymer transport protein ExbD
VTLSEINITPLLDLAFVLLIIFVITTPLLDKGLQLNLPKVNGQTDPKTEQKDIKTVEITPQGAYAMNRRIMKLEQVLAQLKQDFRYNPNIVVYIRADENSRTKDLAALIDGCRQNGITRYSLRTEPVNQR